MSGLRTSISTVALHGGPARALRSGPLVPALVQSTTFLKQSVEIEPEHAYSRVSNPTVSELERRLGALEDARAICFGSGLAAETALLLAVLRAGDHVVCGEAVYGGTVRLLRQVLSGFGVAASFADTSDPAAVRRALRPRTRLIFAETPSNPTLVLADVAALAAIAREAGAVLAVDNTFLTPALQRPLDLGADVAVYSTTKQIEGHAVAPGGALVTRDAGLDERLRFIRKSTGGIIAPFNAWLTVQGLRTLPVRARVQSRHARRVAGRLAAHSLVTCVNYPGLPSFPQRELARRQHLGAHGNVLSFEVAGGYRAAAELMSRLRLCALVEHVGSVETLVTHPASMTHADVPREHRLAVGIADGLVRLSVGLEDPDDVAEDLDRAIEAAHATAGAAAEGRGACVAAL